MQTLLGERVVGVGVGIEGPFVDGSVVVDEDEVRWRVPENPDVALLHTKLPQQHKAEKIGIHGDSVIGVSVEHNKGFHSFFVACRAATRLRA